MRFPDYLLCVAGLILVHVLAVVPAADADLIRVPADQTTISAGIMVATSGDTVLVGPGTYQENIDFLGKNIVVGSHHLISGDTADILATIIDGSNPDHVDTTSCVIFQSGEGPAAKLHGFTITGGAGTVWVDSEYPEWIWRGGGGVFIFQSSPTVTNNLIIDNRATDEGQVHGAQGGGILCFQSDPQIRNNTITSNLASYGGGLAIDFSGGQFSNNLFSGNSGGANWGGGAIWTIGAWSAPIIIDNNTIVGNDSPTFAGALYIWGSAITARNNIIWGNSQANGGPIHLVNGGTIDITYSDVEGSYVGVGNLSRDPHFADTDSYHLETGSQCIDAGNPHPQFNDREDQELPGQPLWPALGTLYNDMGCYGGPGSSILPGEVVTGVGSQGSSGQIFPPGIAPTLLPSYPNPLGQETMICFNLQRSADTSLSVFDIRGRLVTNLLDTRQEVGVHQVHWDGRDHLGNSVTAGIYFLRLSCNGHMTTGKVTLVR